MRMKFAVLFASLAPLALAGCGQGVDPKPLPPAKDGFQGLVEGLQAEAKAKSVNGVEITLSPAKDGEEGTRLVTCRKVHGDTTIQYQLVFKKGSKDWGCTKAIANEVSPGNRIDNQISGNPVDLADLLKWLNW